MAINQLSGGGFQDILGNPIANGIVLLELSQDTVVNNTIQLCSIDVISISLDSEGNVIDSPEQLVWPNDQMTPANTFYKATVYSHDGVCAWGPNSVQVLSNPTPFNISTGWVPSNPA